MTLHMIKLCVGVDDVGDLRDWCAGGRRAIVHTRQTPKRAEEILDGGSLYWVIKGQILVRQPILAIETLGSQGRTRCEIELVRTPLLTEPQPRRDTGGSRGSASDAGSVVRNWSRCSLSQTAMLSISRVLPSQAAASTRAARLLGPGPRRERSSAARASR